MDELESPPSQLDLTLKAASDPTRRAILTLLAQNGPTRITEIARRFSVSLNTISKHIMALERAGLVQRRTVWRAHYIEITLAPLAEVDRWFASLRSIWALRLEALDAILTQEIADEPTDHSRVDDDRDPTHRRPAGPRL